MNEHDAFEQAFKNGYEKGRADATAEIFGEIENNSYKYGVNFLISEETLAELKKKYTEGDK